MKILHALKKIMCKHIWDYDNCKGIKTCEKCGKIEEVFMGWI